MSNKNPSSRLVSVPSQFLPLIENEMNETGCFTQCEVMGRILGKHYGVGPQKATKIEPGQDTKIVPGQDTINEKKSVIQGRKING